MKIAFDNNLLLRRVFNRSINGFVTAQIIERGRGQRDRTTIFAGQSWGVKQGRKRKRVFLQFFLQFLLNFFVFCVSPLCKGIWARHALGLGVEEAFHNFPTDQPIPVSSPAPSYTNMYACKTYGIMGQWHMCAISYIVHLQIWHNGAHICIHPSYNNILPLDHNLKCCQEQ